MIRKMRMGYADNRLACQCSCPSAFASRSMMSFREIIVKPTGYSPVICRNHAFRKRECLSSRMDSIGSTKPISVTMIRSVPSSL